MKSVFTILFALFSLTANAFEIKKVPEFDSNEHITVTLEGDYDRNSYRMISRLLDDNVGKMVIVYANSRGGHADDLYKIMDKIHYHRGGVVWLVNGLCASACAWSAVSSRQVYGRLLFHGVSEVNTGKIAVLSGLELSSRMIQWGIKAGNWYGKELVAVDF